MNTWDEKIYRDSVARDLCPGGFEDQEAFVAGARWQREALLSDEAVERAARALYETDREEEAGDEAWPTFIEGLNDMYREQARAALAAALGEESND